MDLKDIKVESDRLPKTASHYTMNHPRRGVAAIFNQERFENSSINERIGSQQDCNSLCRTFTRLGFEVETFLDLTKNEIETTLLELSNRDHCDCDCFVLAFMSHGLEGQLRARDKIFNVNLLWDNFTAELCPSLANKPKIFFIQACQGRERQASVVVSNQTLQATHLSSPENYVKLVPSYSLPQRADFLVALSTIPGFVSWRHPITGSWYIQTLCRHLDRNGFNQDILTLLTHVQREVALEYNYCDKGFNDCKKQLPSIISLLIRILKFTKKRKSKSAKHKINPGTETSWESENEEEQFYSNPRNLNNGSKRKRSFGYIETQSSTSSPKRKR